MLGAPKKVVFHSLDVLDFKVCAKIGIVPSPQSSQTKIPLDS